MTPHPPTDPDYLDQMPAPTLPTTLRPRSDMLVYRPPQVRCALCRGTGERVVRANPGGPGSRYPTWTFRGPCQTCSATGWLPARPMGCSEDGE